MAAASLLDKVAEHEVTLMAELVSAEEEAQRIVDAAHAKASAHLLDVQNKMDAEILEMRRKAAVDRQETTARIERETAQKVQEIRNQNTDRLDGVKAELLGMILPNKGGAA